MKKLLLTLLAMPLLLASCNNEEMPVNEESVEVNFVAEMPELTTTRAAGDLTVNKVVCAIFDENNNEITSLRTTLAVTDANKNSLAISSRLVKGRSYSVVFWAMKDDNYDVSNMKAITRSATGSGNEADYDAFTAVTSLTVENSETIAVTLTRPLAQLNIGITEEDWNAVADSFLQTPKTCSVSYSASDVFDAFTGMAVGSTTTVTRHSASTGTTFTVEGKQYKHLGTYYVLMAEAEKQTLDMKYTVIDTNDKSIRTDVQIPFVPVQRNYTTNLVGGLLTGVITYNISMQDGFTGEHNKEIP